VNQQIYVRVDAETTSRERSDKGDIDTAGFGVSENARYTSLRGLTAIVSPSMDQSVDLVHLFARGLLVQTCPEVDCHNSASVRHPSYISIHDIYSSDLPGEGHPSDRNLAHVSFFVGNGTSWLWERVAALIVVIEACTAFNKSFKVRLRLAALASPFSLHMSKTDTLYPLPIVWPGRRELPATKILWGQVLTVILIVLVTTWCGCIRSRASSTGRCLTFAAARIADEPHLRSQVPLALQYSQIWTVR
jgi:hypothetical protein